MPLRDKDIEILKAARDDNAGDLNRNALIEAFKRAGATVVRGPLSEIRIQFSGRLQYDLPLGHGPVDLGGRHKTFRVVLHDLAGELLGRCNIV